MYSSKVLLLVALSTCAIAYAKYDVKFDGTKDAPLFKLIEKIKSNQATIIESDLPKEEQTHIAIKVQEIFDLYEDDWTRFNKLTELMYGLFPKTQPHILKQYKAVAYEPAYYIRLIVNDESLALYGTKFCY